MLLIITLLVEPRGGSCSKQTPLYISRVGFLSQPLAVGFSTPPDGSSLPFALGVGGLEDAGGRHEVLDVLAEHLVLRLQLQVLLLDGVDPR